MLKEFSFYTNATSGLLISEGLRHISHAEWIKNNEHQTKNQFNKVVAKISATKNTGVFVCPSLCIYGFNYEGIIKDMGFSIQEVKNYTGYSELFYQRINTL